jgi:hypothetical protein
MSGPKGRSTTCLHWKLSCVFEKEYACLLHPDAVSFDEEYGSGYAKTPQDPEETAPLRRESLPLQKQDKLLSFYTLEEKRPARVCSEFVVPPSRQWFSARPECFYNPAEGGTQRGSSEDCKKAKTQLRAIPPRRGYFQIDTNSRDQSRPFGLHRRSGFGRSKLKLQPLPTIGSLMDDLSNESQKTL